ncbi:L-aminoadipate-semialdehyde dehydrogenase large subunit [Leucoagaricus sp. SymC.cos]|nr:L-aminoadipate-semialdehyde dehydrogenase large subunit [Leucoagaricus sp. SymC.cos]
MTLPAGLLDGIRQELNQGENRYELQIQEMPALNYVYPKLGNEKASDSFEPYPSPSQTPSLDDVAVILHSLGSTGLPKAIPQTHKRLCQWAIVEIPELRLDNPRLWYSAIRLPPFHVIGFYVCLLEPAFHGLSIGIFPPVDTAFGAQPHVPTPKDTLEHAKCVQVTAIVIVPVFLQTWVHSKEDVDFLAELDLIQLFAGGILSTKTGNALVEAGVNLNSMYGSTEIGPACHFHVQRGREKDWEWLEMTLYIDFEWVSQGDGTYECHVLKNRIYVTPYSVGRLDDVIIHSSGEKTVPGPIEDIILTSPFVQDAIVFGHGHDYPGVLIEPEPEYAIDVRDPTALEDLRDKIWPQIGEANKVVPNYSRLFKEMMLITAPDKPLPRAAKGTVIRNQALQAYMGEIETTYINKSSLLIEWVMWSLQRIDTVEKWLVPQIFQMNGGKAILVTEDIFAQGFDSLSIIFLQSRVLSALAVVNPSASDIFSQNTIYAHPTIRKLAQYISDAATSTQLITSSDHSSAIDAMIELYSDGLVPSVFLTGSTGHLGSQILARLLTDPAISRVYAFNRPGTRSIEERHADQFRTDELDVDVLKSNKLRFVEGDLSEKHLSISEDLYDEIRDSVSLIIHNSWRLDFNLSLASFELHVHGVRNLIDLARSGRYSSSLRFIFTSSVASAQSWDSKQGPYPEAVVHKSKYAVGTGYGESKYVAERILECSGLNVCSLRIGQLSGNTVIGAWAVSDWFPILVESGVALGGLPSAPGVISWLPMDKAAQSILDLCFTKEKIPFAVNLMHPRPVAWNQVIEAIQGALVDLLGIDPASLLMIPLPEWIEQLSAKAKDSTPDDLKKIPAIKLIEFFREMGQACQAVQPADIDNLEFGGITMLTQNAKELIPTIQTIPSFQGYDARRWVEYWQQVGFFN